MSKQAIQNPEKRVSTGAYSDGIRAGEWIFVSGQGPLDLAAGKVIAGTIAEETVRTLGNVEAVLRAGGAGLEHVVKCGVHLADIRDFDAFNTAYAEFFRHRGVEVPPARTTVQSVLWGGMKIEIDAIARHP